MPLGLFGGLRGLTLAWFAIGAPPVRLGRRVDGHIGVTFAA
jgi:hypothetical protein